MSRSTQRARSKLHSPLVLGAVVAALVLLAVAGLSSYRDLAAARARQQLLEQKIDAARAQNRELARRIERLQSDPESLERLAREEYRLIRPGDVVIVLPEEPRPRPDDVQPSTGRRAPE